MIRSASAAAVLVAAVVPAVAACDGAVARLTADKGEAFVAERYGVGSYRARTDRGRLTYVVHVWRGKVGKATRFLHFTEIPSTSGPNWGSAVALSAYKTRIDWQPASSFVLPRAFTVYAGPLKGSWTTSCDTAARWMLRPTASVAVTLANPLVPS